MTQLKPAATAARPQEATSAIRSILVHVQSTVEAQPRLHAAVALARKLDATLIGVGAEMIQMHGLSDPYGFADAGWVVEMQKFVQENLRNSEATFRAKTAGLKTEWLALEAMPSSVIAEVSRSADLILAGGAPLKLVDDYRMAQTAELVVKSGRPVLVAPPEDGKFSGEAVVVAWKDTREARRAVADALPFLQMAREVVVQEVCAKDGFADAEVHTSSVVENLKRHGVAARAKVTIAPAERTAVELNVTADAIGADLIVAGGYGHSRLGEWVFGGVTHSLLHEPERFVLLSH
jgi:nucleotide-binding universal stress UspA family protein